MSASDAKMKSEFGIKHDHRACNYVCHTNGQCYNQDKIVNSGLDCMTYLSKYVAARHIVVEVAYPIVCGSLPDHSDDCRRQSRLHLVSLQHMHRIRFPEYQDDKYQSPVNATSVDFIDLLAFPTYSLTTDHIRPRLESNLRTLSEFILACIISRKGKD